MVRGDIHTVDAAEPARRERRTAAEVNILDIHLG
jgi:hypothetical protein